MIDGYNLIATMFPDALSGDLEAKREQLSASLSAYKKLRGVKITIVFDAQGSGRLTEGSFNIKGVSTVFTAKETADDYLKKASVEFGGGLTIITSDNDVAGFAEKNGAVAISSEEFARILENALYYEIKGVTEEDEEDSCGNKKGPSKRPSKKDRAHSARLKKL